MVRGVLGLRDLKGLVLETFGAGNAPEDDELIGVLEEGVKKGVVIVNVTQCQVGTVSPLYASATALARAGVVFGLDMTSEGIFPLAQPFYLDDRSVFRLSELSPSSYGLSVFPGDRPQDCFTSPP